MKFFIGALLNIVLAPQSVARVAKITQQQQLANVVRIGGRLRMFGFVIAWGSGKLFVATARRGGNSGSESRQSRLAGQPMLDKHVASRAVRERKRGR